MNHNRSTKFSRRILNAALWGLAFFATFGMALFAYAINFPDTQPGPASGVVGMFVGGTPNAYSGNIGGYEKANGFCAVAHPDSHICTSNEMVNTYNHNPTALDGITAGYWVNGATPANLESFSNDCIGWSTDVSVAFGYVWDTNLRRGFVTPCDQSRAFACCK